MRSNAPAGCLYVCGTPIGNLDDASPRLLQTLRAVPLIAAEDTRHTRKLLSRFAIPARLVSYHEHNERERRPELLAHLQSGQDLALVSDAGMPTVSDPGRHLVEAALVAGIPVSPIPGPSAVTAALAASGFPADRFVFEGFLPRGDDARRSLLAAWQGEERTIVCFETPARLAETLAAMAEVLGERPLVVTREMTKLHEEIWRGTAAAALAHFGEEPRGEFTLVLAPGTATIPAVAEDFDTEARRLLASGLGVKEASARLSRRFSLTRREAYRRLTEL